MRQIKIEAYAKINLFLDIVNRMDNGFHAIESVMQTVSLADIVDICADESDCTEIKVSCLSGYAPDGEENIVYRAAKAYLEKASLTATVRIDLQKNIPSPAGMGGGSADAAAVLRGLNQIFGRFSTAQLEAIASEIGSDVTFCICGGTRIARGRGEKLCECRELPDCHIVIACGEELLSTSIAYRILDEKYGDFRSESIKSGIESFVSSMDNVDNMASSLYNIFESVTVPLCESTARLKNIMTDCGALGTLMCGSGPAVFGIFADEPSALSAVYAIKRTHNFVTLCKPIKKYLFN